MLRNDGLRTYESKLLVTFLALLAVLAYLVLGTLKQTAGQPATVSYGFTVAHQSFLSASALGLQEQEPLKSYITPEAAPNADPPPPVSSKPTPNDKPTSTVKKIDAPMLGEREPQKTKLPSPKRV